MALHPNFPADPYAPLLPDERWFPAAEELRATAYEKVLPPLVAKIREEIKAWRDGGYQGATRTSQALLAWWFDTEHLPYIPAKKSLFNKIVGAPNTGGLVAAFTDFPEQA